MKRAILKLMRSSGVFASFRELNKHKSLLVTYHRFAPIKDGRSISSDAFEEQLCYLSKHYTLVKLSTLHDSLTTGRSLARSAVITIDDGFNDAYEIAFPILRKYSVPATFFVITDFLDQKIWLWTDKLRYVTSQLPSGTSIVTVNGRKLTFELDGKSSRLNAATVINSVLKTLPSRTKDAVIEELANSLNVVIPDLPPKEYGPVSWDQLIEMDKGGIEIGSHTVTHPILPNVDDAQLRWELSGSRERLQSVLNHPITLFCYPNGSYDERTRRAVGEAGYVCAVTTRPCLSEAGGDPLALPRVPAEQDLDHFIQTTSGFEEVKGLVRKGAQ
jgi:peptidoglycan/xylan/chitin deacetylase (PgdA/CDA1 family)